LHQGWLLQTQQLQQQQQQQQHQHHQQQQQESLLHQQQPALQQLQHAIMLSPSRFNPGIQSGSWPLAEAPLNGVSAATSNLPSPARLPQPLQQIGSPQNHPGSASVREASRAQSAQLTLLEMTQVPYS
jgi:transcription initiation factor TFIID subunit TAF12